MSKLMVLQPQRGGGIVPDHPLLFTITSLMAGQLDSTAFVGYGVRPPYADPPPFPSFAGPITATWRAHLLNFVFRATTPPWPSAPAVTLRYSPDGGVTWSTVGGPVAPSWETLINGSGVRRSANATRMDWVYGAGPDGSGSGMGLVDDSGTEIATCASPSSYSGGGPITWTLWPDRVWFRVSWPALLAALMGGAGPAATPLYLTVADPDFNEPAGVARQASTWSAPSGTDCTLTSEHSWAGLPALSSGYILGYSAPVGGTLWAFWNWDTLIPAGSTLHLRPGDLIGRLT